MATYCSNESRSDYFPPLLGNGDIALYLDCEGTLSFSRKAYRERGQTEGVRVEAPSGTVYRAGRRLPVRREKHADLVPLAAFTFSAGSGIASFTQTLTEESASVSSCVTYADGVTVESRAFVPYDACIYALEKCFDGFTGKRRFSYTVGIVPDYMAEFRPYLTERHHKERDALWFDFTYLGQDIYKGHIAYYVDRPVTVTYTHGGMANLTFEVEAGERVAFYYCIEDDLMCEDARAVVRSYLADIRRKGFDRLFSENAALADAYMQKGYVRTGDDRLNAIYKSALYALRCYTTKHYSIPVGISNVHWDARYFGFDEYYSFLGLIGSCHSELAVRVPEYRRRLCYEAGISRHDHAKRDAVHFSWESGEYGNELAPPGHWYEHVFHMAMVAIGAFDYYEYTGDIESLRLNFPMIRAAAKFYTRHMLYRDGARVYLGKCTDLERLGSSIENAFMSTCGVINTLEVLVRAADILETDREYRDECAETARRLRESLPVSDGRYIPYPGCKDRSIAVYSCVYPFRVTDASDEKRAAAWMDFEENGGAFGNMYDCGGKGINPWYAAWKAEAYARIGDSEKAYVALRQAYHSVGAFNEMFEMNEESLHYRPWFSTAAGMFLSAANEMLLQSDGDRITLLPAFSDGADVSFRLAARGGRTVTAEVKNGDVLSVTVTDKNGVPDSSVAVYYKGKRIKSI